MAQRLVNAETNAKVTFTPCGDCGMMTKVILITPHGTEMEWNVSTHMARVWYKHYVNEGFKQEQL